MQLSFSQATRLFLLMTLFAGDFAVRAAEIFPYGGVWRYVLGTQEASAPDSGVWRLPGFNDTSWTAAPAPIGYANPANAAAEFTLATLTPSTQAGGYSTVFLRGRFVAKSPSAGNGFTVNVNVDDGCIVWVNGKEVGRYNVAEGELPYNQWALSANEPTLTSFSFTNGSAGPVIAGENVIAVQVFNANATSSDLFFDAAVESDLDEAAPFVFALEPPAGGTVTALSHINVVFNENVAGVNAADLLVNGQPSIGMTTISPREYGFVFPAAPTGSVTVAWAPNHGIEDLAKNPFVGSTWTYSVQAAQANAAVIISEFLADNQHGIRDQDGDRTDWLELLNTSSGVADLEGWFLTDDPANLTQWRLPAVTLDSNKSLLIFASGKDRTNTAAPFHTNFKIEKSGGYLALVNRETNIVSAFIFYPAQQADRSYGRDAGSTAVTGYFVTPTPGAANSTSGTGFSGEVELSLPGGVYTNNALLVTLTANSGQIRYTTDGSVPTTNSSAYTGPITLSASAVLKARAFEANLLPGPIAAATYTLVDSGVANFTSNLPLLILSTGGRAIGQDASSRTLAAVVAVDTFRGRSSVLGKPEFLGQAGIEVRGQSSTGFPKQQYNVTFEDPYRQQEGVGLFGLPADADWALYAPYTDKSFLQNFLAYELYEKMGHYSVRRRFVEVFLDRNGGKVSYGTDYAGIYILVEKIKIDKNRVDLDELTPYNNAEPDISGGYMFKKDKDSPGDYTFSTPGSSTAGFSGQTLKLHQPKPAAASLAQKNWLRNYLAQMEKALYASNWKTATGTNHWSYYLDADSFVDNHWMVEFAKQIDGYRLSTYFYKPRNGKVHMSPIWDYNLSFGNADYLDGENTENWYWQELGDGDHIWLRRLMCGTASSGGTAGDPDFNQKIVDRWSELRTNVLASSNVIARAQELATVLGEAAERDFQRWPRLGTYVWPNPPLYSTPTTYAGIMKSFTNWVKGRCEWIDSQMPMAPSFNLPAGLTPPGSSLVITATGSGVIYYSMDGSDPRLPGGGISPKALRYSSPVTLAENRRVFARRLNGSVWSGPAVHAFSMEKPALAITEIMYHPAAAPAGSGFTAVDFEFIELKNTGSKAIELAGTRISGGIQFIFPGGALSPGSYVAIAKNRAAFQSRYGAAAMVAGEFSGELDNGGDHLVLTGGLGEPIAEIAFKDGWYPSTDGAGFSLIRSESSPGDELSDPEGWHPSSSVGGSPGLADERRGGTFPRVVISELITASSTAPSQSLELQNLSPSAADIGGWFITDDLQKPKKFRVPEGVSIPSGGFAVFTSEDFSGPAATEAFVFNAGGEEVYLFSADKTGNLTGYIHGFKFGALRQNASFGRYFDTQGVERFITQERPTFGETNAGPADVPVIISEVMYHPTDVLLNNSSWNNTEDEFLELFNRSAAPVNLFEGNITNTWRVDGGVQFAFPPGTVLQPSSFAVLVSFDPLNNPAQAAAFRARYALSGAVPLYGPYTGSLGNEGDRVALGVPVNPAASSDVHYVTTDEVEYRDEPPWNPAADGFGLSLSRRDLRGYGNDSGKWTARPPSPGSVDSGDGELPVIIAQPRSQFVTGAQSVSFIVGAAGTNPLKYQWLFKGKPIAQATNATLSLPAPPPEASGDYAALVFGMGGAVLSDPAFLFVGSDSDGDGMPDAWEYANGLRPFDGTDASADTDGDGFSNRDEYLAGTDPQIAQSALSVAALSAGGVRFLAAPKRGYSVFYSDSLTEPSWKKLADVSAAVDGGEVLVPDVPSGPQRFYRIITPAQ